MVESTTSYTVTPCVGSSSDEHSISHTDSYELNNGILYDHDNEQPIFGPNPQNASTPECQKSTQGNSLKGILINTNSVKSIEKATQLKATIHYSNPDIIFLVEVQIRQQLPNILISPTKLRSHQKRQKCPRRWRTHSIPR